MQIVIDINESLYEVVISSKVKGFLPMAMRGTIICGTILPKGHGRLIDADELYAEFADGTEGVDFSHWTRADIAEAIDDAPTIIEADKGETE